MKIFQTLSHMDYTFSLLQQTRLHTFKQHFVVVSNYSLNVNRLLCTNKHQEEKKIICNKYGCKSGPGCSKLMTSLVNVSLKFKTLISQIRQYFLLKKCEKLLQLQKLLSFFQQKISVCLVTKS